MSRELQWSIQEQTNAQTIIEVKGEVETDRRIKKSALSEVREAGKSGDVLSKK